MPRLREQRLLLLRMLGGFTGLRFRDRASPRHLGEFVPEAIEFHPVCFPVTAQFISQRLGPLGALRGAEQL